MRKTLTAIGDRMLAMVVPATSAAATICKGRHLYSNSQCTWTCYTYSGGNRQTKYRTCDNGPCVVVCSDCC